MSPRQRRGGRRKRGAAPSARPRPSGPTSQSWSPAAVGARSLPRPEALSAPPRVVVRRAPGPTRAGRRGLRSSRRAAARLFRASRAAAAAPRAARALRRPWASRPAPLASTGPPSASRRPCRRLFWPRRGRRRAVFSAARPCPKQRGLKVGARFETAAAPAAAAPAAAKAARAAT
ncbi:hypothetical protein M885DRAFT_511316 [Pelagophyceae sp. CCMP2097]|nr:hypothetical protein M885DRAFT_511316 [Pelagophyceae sp. CCMP2097]